MNKKDEFKPYIPADRVMPELTVTSIIMGVLLAVIFGAANAYLGLRVGMTVSASIPAAVISMGVIRIIMRKNSILESNMVQTIGSAGESLAAGAIFTMPALFLWAEEGLCSMPSLVEITLIALCGGVLGVLFMVPLRNALIVKEHQTLLYPEGTACADVLLAGEEGGANASTVFSGMGLAAVFKFIVDGLKVIPADVSAAFKSFKGEIGMEVYPALLGVGYIVGPKIASYMFVGSVFGWLVIIPLICLFGPDTWLYPAEAGTTIAQLYAGGGASAIWSTYVKYIGAGAIATGGIISLIKSLPLIVKTFSDSMKSVKGGKNTSTARTAQDLPMQFILIGIVAMVVIIWAVPAIPVTLLGAALIVIFGFFFATVSSRMVVFPQPDNHIAVFLRNVYYADHKYYDIYVTVMQSIWVFVLGAVAVSGLRKENRQEIIVLMLSIVGLTLFEVLFEARARYLYTYAPVFCILAAIGIEKLNSEIKKKSRL